MNGFMIIEWKNNFGIREKLSGKKCVTYSRVKVKIILFAFLFGVQKKMEYWVFILKYLR